MNQTNPPISTAWFQRLLDQATKDHSLSLRIRWAPQLTREQIVLVNGEKVLKSYAKYPLLGRTFTPYVNGIRFVRTVGGKQVAVGYQRTGGLVKGNVLPTDVAQPDYEEVNYSVHLFVIENRLPDAEARKMWAEKARMAEEVLGFSLWGEFPAEGVWDYFDHISEHYGECCDMADERGVRCWGLYRQPDSEDLERVRQSLAVRDQLPNYADRSQQIAQVARDMNQAQWDWIRQQKAEYLQAAGEIGRLAQRSIEKPSVYLDSRKVNNGNHNDKDS